MDFTGRPGNPLKREGAVGPERAKVAAVWSGERPCEPDVGESHSKGKVDQVAIEPARVDLDALPVGQVGAPSVVSTHWKQASEGKKAYHETGPN